MDYQRLMGVEHVAESCDGGRGVKIAILDSGTPKPAICGCSVPVSEGEVDEYGHATAVSSILFGGWGIKGICGNASPRYYAVLDSHGVGSVKSVAKGIYKAIDDGADIINLSLGFARSEKCPRALEDACCDAYEAGKAVICAAGNDGGPVNWPAALKTTISVGSSGKNGLKAAFSSVGEVDFVAPGVDLSVLCPDGRVKTVSGTSFSAALVTGVAALLLGTMRRDGTMRPDVDDIMSALRGMASDIEDPGWDSCTGYGRISGKTSDTTVCMKIDQGFFDRIIGKIKSLIGFVYNKENNNGRV